MIFVPDEETAFSSPDPGSIPGTDFASTHHNQNDPIYQQLQKTLPLLNCTSLNRWLCAFLPSTNCTVPSTLYNCSTQHNNNNNNNNKYSQATECSHRYHEYSNFACYYYQNMIYDDVRRPIRDPSITTILQNPLNHHQLVSKEQQLHDAHKHSYYDQLLYILPHFFTTNKTKSETAAAVSSYNILARNIDEILYQSAYLFRFNYQY
jgi:hypothetical protein